VQQLQLPNSNPEWKTAIDGYLRTVASTPAKKPNFLMAIIPNGDEHKYSMVRRTPPSVPPSSLTS
jgi:hypothetical protein